MKERTQDWEIEVLKFLLNLLFTDFLFTNYLTLGRSHILFIGKTWSY